MRRIVRALVDRLPSPLVRLVHPWVSSSLLLRRPADLLSEAQIAQFGPSLVIAPHPDDETLGCGGVIALLRSVGHDVHVLFVTDGSASHPTDAQARARLVAARRREALGALGVLGVPPEAAHFAMLPDGALPTEAEEGFDEAVRVVGRELEPLAFQTVLLPWRRDSSPDHRAAWDIVTASLRQLRRKPRILEFPVWAWLRDEDAPAEGEMRFLRAPIAGVQRVKRRAIACYATQLCDSFEGGKGSFRLRRSFLAHFDRAEELLFEQKPPDRT
ncbi:PIG-L deacetylase family protein [Alsobacter sp. KACC 23698]|uniref:PIG-L deacetylase family protein n=1 Tax=Alsobacter sp. KACC 23698 TaxID=3149229 RepID=A0AAU7JJU8_9HYPH